MATEAAFHLPPASCRAWAAASQLPLLLSLASPALRSGSADQQPPKFQPHLEVTHLPARPPSQAVPEQPLGHSPPHKTLPRSVSAELLFLKRKRFSPFPSSLRSSQLFTLSRILFGGPSLERHQACPFQAIHTNPYSCYTSSSSTALPWKGTFTHKEHLWSCRFL